MYFRVGPSDVSSILGLVRAIHRPIDTLFNFTWVVCIQPNVKGSVVVVVASRLVAEVRANCLLRYGTRSHRAQVPPVSCAAFLGTAPSNWLDLGRPRLLRLRLPLNSTYFEGVFLCSLVIR